jgi:metal-sulfur cluster biosynthetic enzyme
MTLVHKLSERLSALLAPPPSPAIYALAGAEGALLDKLRDVIDPEVGLDIVSMGLIRSVTFRDAVAVVQMTFTTEGCPAAFDLYEDVKEAIVSVGFTPQVEVVFDPPWSPEHIAPEARAGL